VRKIINKGENMKEIEIVTKSTGDGDCWMCDRDITTKTAQHVHMTTSQTLIPVAAESEDLFDSQGYFMVGPDCKKKIAKIIKKQGADPKDYFVEWINHDYKGG
jgi:hypothetical protein